MSTYLVLKTLPHGQQPGETVELNDDEARVFLTVDAVRALITTEAPSPEKPKRRYSRRDLQAQD